MGIKKIEVDTIEYMVQSYLKNDFANIVMLSPRRSFNLDLFNCNVQGTSGKQDKIWVSLAEKINVANVKLKLEKLFNDNINKD